MNLNQDKSDKLRKWSSEVSVFEAIPSNSNLNNEKEKSAGKIRPSSTYDALTFEQQLVWKDGYITEKYTVRRFQLTHFAGQLVEQLIDDILDYVVEAAERRKREQIVENYLTRAIPAPLVSRDEVQHLGESLGTASLSLQSSTIRLRAAWKLILVSTAQQLCLSYRRILERYDFSLRSQLEEQGFEPRSILTDASSGLLIKLIKERIKIYVEHRKKRTRSRDEVLNSIGSRNKEDNLKISFEVQTEQSSTKNETENEVELENENKGLRDDRTETELENALVKYFEDHDIDASDTERSESDALVETISSEAYTELQEVTDRVLTLAVEYLKNATFNLVEEASDEVKQIVCTRL